MTAFIATLGPQTGLRTMVITRYSSGYIGCTIYSILNILTQYVLVFLNPAGTYILEGLVFPLHALSSAVKLWRL